MKRSRLPRSRKPLKRTPLKRGKPLQRKSRLRRYNPERRERLFRRQFGSEERVRWYQSHACATCHAAPPSECSHVRTRGAGAGPEDMIPQCEACHQELHHLGPTRFEARFGVDLGELATNCNQEWEETQT